MGPRTYWNQWFKERGHTILEIALGKNYLSYEPARLKKIAAGLEGFDLSLHTATTCLFSDEPGIINEAQQKSLFAEIAIAKFLGATELVFHMPTDTSFEKIENNCKRFFAEILPFAKANDASLILENNSRGSFANEHDIKWFIDNIANVDVCIDVGHLNRAAALGLTTPEQFISVLQGNITHAHIHNNTGEADEHKSISQGTFPYKSLLSKLTAVRKFIIEVNDYAGALETEHILRELLGTKD